MARYSNRPTTGCCLECGAVLPPARHGGNVADFCGGPCRKRHFNRRRARGADLYDLFMACRFSRDEAESEGAWNLMCRMASAFKAQDDRERAGRRSWVAVQEIRTRRPDYVATTVERNYRCGR